MKTYASLKDRVWFDGQLTRLITGSPLSSLNSKRLFEMIFSENIPFQKSKTVLLLLARRGETADELLGCLQALQKLEKPIGPKIPSLMDTCGTGGDGRHTLNVSTLVALVIAGAGGKVAKHGNRAISSKSGSSDLMESFGIKLNATSKKTTKAIKRCGLGYFHAPFYHPVFAKMQPLRRSLKRRTILNLLGPLTNPMRLDHQLVGVSCKRHVSLYAKVLASLGRKSSLVCHSLNGMDEISTEIPTRAAWVTPGKIRTSIIRPRQYGLKKASIKDIRVDSVKKSRTMAENILSGKEHGPARDMIILNAAFGLFLCRKAKTISEGIRLAQESLASGKAANVLKQLKEITN